ncbi:hypothetical protein [Micromonospora halophytica]|uniref:Uncharacterized protein n=1 Tax=Micromonospora halophytica TaxID=47864 RepID=A0A1C5HHE1_9ACTN|nr:hypothetical protein [Micromonospora halophytica]SCG45420.1 hypothetical protein GA0070560_104193 [Micromonospora halophytica]
MTTSDRRLIAGGALAVVAAVAVGGWWLSRPELPTDWSGRDRFCAEAETFALTNQAALTGEQRSAAMAALIRVAPRELTPDLQRLAGSIAADPAQAGHDHGPVTPEAGHDHDAAGDGHDHDAAGNVSGAPADAPEVVAASGRRAGEFIERACGINLPNVRT